MRILRENVFTVDREQVLQVLEKCGVRVVLKEAVKLLYLQSEAWYKGKIHNGLMS